MSPLRIIIIAILIYLAYRLIVGGRKTPTGGGDKVKTEREMPISDTLEEDPVCKKLVPRAQAVQLDLNGTTHYFCSRECCKTFRSRQGEDT